MSAETFLASCGREVKAGPEEGSLEFGKLDGYLSAECVVDAAEYFQAKRDAELGRWRWPDDPRFVVYPGYSPGEEERFVRVVEENTGVSTLVYESQRDGVRGHNVATAYFEAHPESKPWHDAKAGEFWQITHNGMVEVCRVDDVHDVLHFVGVQYKSPMSKPVTHPSITDAVQLVVSEPSSQAGLQSFRSGL